MGTEKNEPMDAPIPAPPATPAGRDQSTRNEAAVASAPTPGRGKKRAMAMGIVIGVLLVLVVAGVVAIKVANSSRTPEAQVRAYLDLLAAGNASAATAMVDPGVANDQRTFLTDGAMASAQSRLVIEDVVADRNDESSTRSVTATMQVNGERFTHQFTVTKAKPTMGVLDNWQVKDALVTQVSVDAQGYTQFTVGDESADAPKKQVTGEGATFFFYPGVYTFTPVAPSEYVDSTPVTVAVLDVVHRTNTDGDASDVSLVATYNNNLKDAALEAGTKIVDSCASIPGNQNSVCPFAIQSDALTAISVKTMPTSMEPLKTDPGAFQGHVTFTATYSNKYYMEGTRDVDTVLILDVQFDSDGLLKLDQDGKPDFRVSFAR